MSTAGSACLSHLAVEEVWLWRAEHWSHTCLAGRHAGTPCSLHRHAKVRRDFMLRLGRSALCRPTEAWEVFQAGRVGRAAFEDAGPVVLSSPDLVRSATPGG